MLISNSKQLKKEFFYNMCYVCKWSTKEAHICTEHIEKRFMIFSYVQTFPSLLHPELQSGGDYGTSFVPTSAEAARSRALSLLMVSRDSYSLSVLAHVQITFSTAYSCPCCLIVLYTPPYQNYGDVISLCNMTKLQHNFQSF